MSALIDVDEAQRRVLDAAQPLRAEAVPIAEAAGRILAEDARAAVDLPPFRSSAMDGFAVRSADTPGRLHIVARVAAGRPTEQLVGRGEAIAIATGGVVPDGADAVVPLEYVVEDDNDLDVPVPVRLGDNTRPRGGDMAAGDVVVGAGTRLGAAQVGALAAAGIAAPSCAARPRVAVVTTGTELRAPGEELRAGEVYEANGVLLAAALAAAGAEVVPLGTVEDDPDAHRRLLERGLGFDVLVTSGGVSVGPHDLVRTIERELGVEEVFWGVAVKPGKPVSFGVRDRTLVFGLPGNPVSSLVAFELFVRPGVLALQGAAQPLPERSRGVLTATVRRNADRDQFLRGRSRVVDGLQHVEPLVGQESHMIARAAAADVLVHVPRGDGEVAAGAEIELLPLSG